MNEAGRNDPCPCGSGKKYKKCHGAATFLSPDFNYERIRRLDGELGNLLLRFAHQRFGKDIFQEAWSDFILDEDEDSETIDAEEDFFDRWFTIDWKPDGEKKISELFLEQERTRISPDLVGFVEATLNSPYSFFQVTDVYPGKKINLHDVLRKRDVEVIEKLASTILERGYIIYARVVALDGIFFMMGCGSNVLLPKFLNWILDARKEVTKLAGLDDYATVTKALLSQEEDLRKAYFMYIKKSSELLTEIRNTDGDPLAFHTLTYTIPSLEEAFDGLKDLETSASRTSDEELYKSAERDARGNVTTLKLQWLKRGKNPQGGNTILGTMALTDATLVVEVNSEKRSKRIRKEIEKRMGRRAVLLKTEIKTQEGALGNLKDRRTSPEPHEESVHERLMRESPEARKVVEEVLRRHWETWPDKPIPALRGQTPRQAAKHPEGRELLESLFMEFEMNDPNNTDDIQRVDVARLRRELGLDRK